MVNSSLLIMTEKQVGFLYKVATMLSPVTNDNERSQVLRSYYLMRCKEITKGYGLPRQQFSNKNRCSYCCLEWTRHSETKVKSNKVSKRQKKRIRQKKRNKDFLYSKKIEQICSFCKHSNSWTVLKPNVETKNKIKQTVVTAEKSSSNSLEPTENPHRVQKGNKELNVYSNARQVFSLSNVENIICKTVDSKPKPIKNNKKKKDKFAGLCKNAVLAAAKLKEKKEPNKLSLFLKPSVS